MAASQLPDAEITQPRLGFLRLNDSAPLLVAQDQRLYEKYGLSPRLELEVSWANLRDRVTAGDLDAAQMLAPLPLSTALGTGAPPAELITGLVLSLNGNAISVGSALANALRELGADAGESAQSTARALATYLAQRGDSAPLTFATTHTFSCHNIQLRHWLQAGGIDPDRDVRIIVLPPEQMVDNLSRGTIDGFCVGEPWNTVAVQQGVGVVQATGYQVWNNAVEKVLATTSSWHQQHPGTHLRLRLALMEACAWLASADNREQAAALMSDYLDLPVQHLLPSFSGRFQLARGMESLDLPHFHVFGRFQAGFPWHCEAQWLLQQFTGLLDIDLDPERQIDLVERTFLTDLYREAAEYLGVPSPSVDRKPDERHNEVYQLEPQIELGPNRRIGDLRTAAVH